MLFGSAFDASCTVWQETCGGQGSCFYYDNKYLGYYMTVSAGCVKFAACVFMFLAWKLYKPPKYFNQEMTVGSDKNTESNKAFNSDEHQVNSGKEFESAWNRNINDKAWVTKM